MSFKVWVVKTAINITPNFVVSSVGNIILKGIAEISDFTFDLDTRTASVQILLAGEQEAIEVALDGFAIVSDENSHQFIIQQAQSNKLWLNNIFSRVVGKAWPIPDQPKYRAQIELFAELLQAEESSE